MSRLLSDAATTPRPRHVWRLHAGRLTLTLQVKLGQRTLLGVHNFGSPVGSAGLGIGTLGWVRRTPAAPTRWGATHHVR